MEKTAAYPDRETVRNSMLESGCSDGYVALSGKHAHPSLKNTFTIMSCPASTSNWISSMMGIVALTSIQKIDRQSPKLAARTQPKKIAMLNVT